MCQISVLEIEKTERETWRNSFRKRFLSMMNEHLHPFTSEVIVPERHCSKVIQKSSHSNDLLEILSSDNVHPHSTDSSDNSDESNRFSDDDLHRLKPLIRSIIWPVNDPIRQHLWRNLLVLTQLTPPKTSSFARLTSQTAATSISWIIDHPFNSHSLRSDQWPNFVDLTHLSFYYLNESTSRVILQRILWTFSFQHPEVTFAPLIQPLASLFLHYHSEAQVFLLINRLCKKHWLCGQTRLQWQAHVAALGALLLIRNVHRPRKTFTDHSLHTLEICLEIPRCSLETSEPVFRRLFLVDLSFVTISLSRNSSLLLMDLSTNLLFFAGENSRLFSSRRPESLLSNQLNSHSTVRQRSELIDISQRTGFDFFPVAMKRSSNGRIRTMSEFCEQISVSIGRLLKVGDVYSSIKEMKSSVIFQMSFDLRNLKRRTIEELIESEEEWLDVHCLSCRCADVAMS